MHNNKPTHIKCLTKQPKSLVTTIGHKIDVWTLSIEDAYLYLTSWAKNFRQNYCLDNELDTMRAGTGYSRCEYLKKLIFPDKNELPGPSIRSGDFAELLIFDYLEYIQGYIVSRGKYAEKKNRNESIKGVDVIGLKFEYKDKSSFNDILITFEVKAKCSGNKYTGQLQKAINDSSKDHIRLATTLNASKRRLRKSRENKMFNMVQRFQNPTDNKYIYKSGAAAILTTHSYNEEKIIQSDVTKHENVENLELIVIKGDDLMTLVHALYKEATNGA